MKSLASVLILVTMVAGVGTTTTASADGFGPFCITTAAPLNDTYRFFLTTIAQNIFAINGSSIPGIHAGLIYGTLQLQQSSAVFAFTGGAQGSSPFGIAGSISLTTGTGSAQCQNACDVATGVVAATIQPSCP